MSKVSEQCLAVYAAHKDCFKGHTLEEVLERPGMIVNYHGTVAMNLIRAGVLEIPSELMHKAELRDGDGRTVFMLLLHFINYETSQDVELMKTLFKKWQHDPLRRDNNSMTAFMHLF